MEKYPKKRDWNYRNKGLDPEPVGLQEHQWREGKSVWYCDCGARLKKSTIRKQQIVEYTDSPQAKDVLYWMLAKKKVPHY